MAKTNDNAGRPADTYTTMRSRIERAGFINVQQKDYICPLGGWHPDPTMRDAGIIGKEVFKSGAEGWVMWLLTNYGLPQPWTADQVRLFVARVQIAMNNEEAHSFHRARRIWAQKPFGPEAASTRELETGTETETGAEQTGDEAADGKGGNGGGEQAAKKKNKKKRPKKKKSAVAEEDPADTA